MCSVPFINKGMLLNDVTKVIVPIKTPSLLETDLIKLKSQCSQFMSESGGLPVYKTINKTEQFVKVKARLRKGHSQFSETFNKAFEHTSNLRQRAIFAHGQQLTESNQYYLFPTNGFKYVYNPQIENSSIYEGVQSSVDDEVFADLLKQNYTNSMLSEGIESGSELLFHNVPFCYAVNTGIVDSYGELLSLLK